MVPKPRDLLVSGTTFAQLKQFRAEWNQHRSGLVATGLQVIRTNLPRPPSSGPPPVSAPSHPAPTGREYEVPGPRQPPNTCLNRGKDRGLPQTRLRCQLAKAVEAAPLEKQFEIAP